MLSNKSQFRLRRSHRHIPEGFLFLLEGQPHPLLIPSIIDEVASYLRLPDLKSFRQVCKTWNVEALKQVRKVGKIVIQDEERLVQFTKLLHNDQSQYMNFELRGDLDLGSASVINFFKIFGNPIAFVYFNRIRWQESDLKNILFRQLPNLEALAVEARAYSDRRLFNGSDDGVLPKIKVLQLNVFSFITELTTPFLQDLLRACPNLETISSLRTEKRNPLPMQFIQYVCSEMSFDSADDVVNMPFASDIAISEALIETKDVNLSHLTGLDCNMRLRTHGIQQLALRNFPLKQLDLTVMSDVTSQTLHNLLHSVENTLDKLKLKFHPRCLAANELAIPPLKNLKHLTLNGYRHSLKFLETVPNLKSLILIRLYFAQALAKEGIELKFESNLNCLEVHEDFSRKCGQNTMNVLIALFPGVKQLKLENLTNDAVCAIFRGYPQLETFDGMNGRYSDSGITGIPIDVFNTCSDPDKIEEFEKLRQLPSIVDLKNLRNLKLASPRITDLSVLYGILRCHNLRTLHLLSNGVTDVSLERILEELDLFHLKTEYCYKLSKSVVNYAKKKMRGRYVSINEYEGPLKQSEIPKFMRRNGRVAVVMNHVNIEALKDIEAIETIEGCSEK